LDYYEKYNSFRVDREGSIHIDTLKVKDITNVNYKDLSITHLYSRYVNVSHNGLSSLDSFLIFRTISQGNAQFAASVPLHDVVHLVQHNLLYTRDDVKVKYKMSGTNVTVKHDIHQYWVDHISPDLDVRMRDLMPYGSSEYSGSITVQFKSPNVPLNYMIGERQLVLLPTIDERLVDRSKSFYFKSDKIHAMDHTAFYPGTVFLLKGLSYWSELDGLYYLVDCVMPAVTNVYDRLSIASRYGVPVIAFDLSGNLVLPLFSPGPSLPVNREIVPSSGVDNFSLVDLVDVAFMKNRIVVYPGITSFFFSVCPTIMSQPCY